SRDLPPEGTTAEKTPDQVRGYVCRRRSAHTIPNSRPQSRDLPPEGAKSSKTPDRVRGYDCYQHSNLTMPGRRAGISHPKAPPPKRPRIKSRVTECTPSAAYRAFGATSPAPVSVILPHHLADTHAHSAEFMTER